MIDGDGSSRWTMKSMQNEKVAKTSGGSKNFEHERLEARHVDNGLLADVASEAKRRLTMLK